MKNLIYSVAYGLPEHFVLAQEWVNSIRASGCATKIILLTDREIEIKGAEVIVCLFMTPSQFWKAAIRNVVECEKYDKILFMDTDIVCLKNPNVFFELEGIQIPREEPLTITKSGLNPVFLTEEEKEKFGNDFSYNAGTIVMPGKWANTFWTEWETEWKLIDWKGQKDYWPDTKIYKGQMYDQGILQAMICRELFSRIPVPMDNSLVGFPAWTEPKDHVVLHLCGLKHNLENKNFIRDIMIALRDKTKVNEICKGLREKADPLKFIISQLNLAMDVITSLREEIRLLKERNETRFRELEERIKEPDYARQST